MLLDQFNDDLKTAMKAGDSVKVSTLRLLISACKNEKIAKLKDLTDEDIVVVLKRQAKQRKDSIEQYTQGGRQDLVDREAQELAMIDAYLPEQMSREDVEKVVKAKIAELGVTDKSGMGKLMGAVMKELQGQADGNTVKEVVSGLL